MEMISREIQKGTIVEFVPDGMFHGRTHIVSDVGIASFYDEHGNEIAWDESKWKIAEPTSHHLSRLFDVIDNLKISEEKAARLSELEQDALRNNATISQKNGEIRRLNDDIVKKTLAIGKHENQILDKDQTIAQLRNDYSKVQDDELYRENARKSEEVLLEMNEEIQDQLAAEKLITSDLKRDITKLRSTDYQRSLQQDLKIQHYTLTGVEPRLMDAEIAQRRSDGWEVVNYSDIPLYHTEGQDEIKAHYSYRHIVRFERVNTEFVPENHIVAVVELPEGFDEAITVALGKDNDGSHIGALTSPTMADVADVIFTPIDNSMGCPKCEGSGTNGDLWSSGFINSCETCNGSGIVPQDKASQLASAAKIALDNVANLLDGQIIKVNKERKE